MGAGTELTPATERRVEREIGALRQVSDFLGDAIDAVKDADLTKQAAHASSWLSAVGGALAEAVPLVKFAVKLFERLTSKGDAEELGFLACSAAYQKGVVQALHTVGAPEEPKQWSADMRLALDALRPAEDIIFVDLRLDDALAHPFVLEADRFLDGFAQAVGYTGAERRKLIAQVHARFVVNLTKLLWHRDTRERYAPYTDAITKGAEAPRAAAALLAHANYQRALFEEAPVLGREPFALQHVYVSPQCGRLSWGAIKNSAGDKRTDPFSEQQGGREDLLAAVFDLMGDPTFRDAIVIQGVAGAGKSSFTLRLCAALVDEGLRPIRVRLRDVRFDKHVSEALPEAVRFADVGNPAPPGASPVPDDLFVGGSIFKEHVSFGEAEIAPYVLILDGWDEISVSTSEGFQNRVEKFLAEVRSEYLGEARPLPVRVILTGRPATAVFESRFLRDRTPVLTLRPFLPDQLEDFVQRTKEALDARPVEGAAGEPWTIPSTERFASVFERYRDDFEALLRPQRAQREEREPLASGPQLDVLGLPLLAHVALRLMSAWPGELQDLIANPTTLFRSLVDFACYQGDLDPTDRARIAGDELRELLRRTAAAITARGEENISHDELELRIGSRDVDRDVRRATEGRPLTALMISFFFKGGHRDLGCEFVHKSFREYLFAEAIVEALKRHGREVSRPPFERAEWWRDFEPGDPRFTLSRELGRLLGPQWLDPEVSAHVRALLSWEIARALDPSLPAGAVSTTRPLEAGAWAHVRDALADLWDWWSEGAHLRPRIARMRPTPQYGESYAEELAIASLDAPRSNREAPIPPRTTAIDAHLGDALFQLAATVHFEIAVAAGWREGRNDSPPALWQGVTPLGRGPRRCQAAVGEVRLFSPSGAHPMFFANYAARINAAGWRPGGAFPAGTSMPGIDLRGAVVSVPYKRLLRFPTDWGFANLERATLIGDFEHNNLGCVFAPELTAVLTMFGAATLDRAYLVDAQLHGVALSDAILDQADLTGAKLPMAWLVRTSLVRAKLNKAVLDRATLAGADLTGADLRHADLENSNLSSALLNGADLAFASLYRAQLEDARMQGVNLEGARLADGSKYRSPGRREGD